MIILFVWKCKTCGCLWRDNLDETVSLLDARQKSCSECEFKASKEACQPFPVRLADAFEHAQLSILARELDSCVSGMEEHLDNEKFVRKLKGGADENDPPMPCIKVSETEIVMLRARVTELQVNMKSAVKIGDPAVTPTNAKQPCILGKYCSDHGFIHGAEAEELRGRLEKLVDGVPTRLYRSEIREILDVVDARDSLAYCEIVDAAAAAE